MMDKVQEALILDCFTKQMTPREIKAKYSSITFPTILRLESEWKENNLPVADFGVEMHEVGSAVRRLEVRSEVQLREDMLNLAQNLVNRTNHLVKNAPIEELVPLSMVIVNLALVVEKIASNSSSASILGEFINED